MRIGVDLDHTILKQEEGKSQLLFGFKSFVMEQRAQDRQILVLCYTEDQTEEQIRATLRSHDMFADSGSGGLGFSDNDLIFVGSNEEMVAKIKALKLTHFIDTQPGLMVRDDFPKIVQPLILGKGLDEAPGFSDWSALSDYFVWGQGLEGKLQQIEVLRDYGENHVFKISNEQGQAMVLKRRLQDADSCIAAAEEAGLSALRKIGFDNIPEPIWSGDGWTLSSWIGGKSVAEANEDHVKQISDFLIALVNKREALRSENLGNASDARLSLQAYIDKVNAIWKDVMAACQRPDGPKDVLLFMMTDMEQMRQDNQNHLYLWCKRQGWVKEDTLPDEKLIFGPSSYGIHKAIESDGRLFFYDFEGCGWDDPAHLMANLFYNPANNLTQDQKLEVLHSFVAGIEDGQEFMNRFWAVADVVAVEWIFKTLYVIVPDEMRRQVYLNPGLDPKQLIKDRFNLALKMHESFTPMENLCKHDQLLDSDSELK